MARPLTKITDEGKLYVRPPGVERSIDEALGQNVETVINRAKISDRNDSNYMSTECLLHLYREGRTSNNKIADRLLPHLLKRCEKLLKAAIPDGGRGDAADLRDEILQSFSEELAKAGTKHDDGTLDFFEIRFNRAFVTYRFDKFKVDGLRRKTFQAVPEVIDEDGGVMDDENALALFSDAAQHPARQENLTYLRQVFKFLTENLTAAELEAFKLVRCRNYNVESKDPTEVTAATICGVSGRMIRKRLEIADELLKQFKKEE